METRLRYVLGLDLGIASGKEQVEAEHLNNGEGEGENNPERPGCLEEPIHVSSFGVSECVPRGCELNTSRTYRVLSHQCLGGLRSLCQVGHLRGWVMTENAGEYIEC